MKIIIIGDEFDKSHQYDFEHKWLYFAAAGLLLLVLSLCISLVVSAFRAEKISAYKVQLSGLSEQMLFDRYELDSFNTYAHSVFNEHARQAASLRARIARLEALGGQVADMAGLNSEFDFYSEPAVGGPMEPEDIVADISGEPMHEEIPLDAAAVKPTVHINSLPAQENVLQALADMRQRLAVREYELKAIEGLLANKELTRESYLAGKPIEKGWLSSHYGKRTDPFTGRTAWHHGVDFAGSEGSNVLAVGSGVVTWAGERYGYGQLVEINHGNGYSTRYGHNRNNDVAFGDVVTKGQVVAQMGSTGRSTGPHVHFEVLKNGRAVDPAQYIYRKSL